MVAETAVRSSMVKAICFVGAALVIGQNIPAMGFMPWPTSVFDQEQLLRVSIFSTGITSWMSAWAIIQVWLMVAYWMRPIGQTSMPVANALSPITVGLTLGISGYMWLGFLQAYAQMLLHLDITQIQLWCGVITGMAGTAVLVYLARFLDHVSPGNGFFGVIALSQLLGFAVSLPGGIEFYTTGGISLKMALFSLALCAVLFAVTVFLMQAKQKADDLTPQHVFAILILTAAASPMLSTVVLLVFEDNIGQLNEILPDFARGQAFNVIFLLSVIVMTIVFGFLFAARNALNANTWLKLAALTIMYTVQELNALLNGLPWSAIPVLTMAVLGWCAHHLYQAMPKKRASPHVENVDFDDEFRRGWRN